MSADRALLVFVLGSFRDVQVGGTVSKGVIARLVSGLRGLGWDAFMSGDERSREVAGGLLSPREMTERLEPRCDLAVYMAVPEGREGGWVAELVAMQLRHPEAASKRVLMVKEGYELSSMLKAEEGAYLADPPVATMPWGDEGELLSRTNAVAAYVALNGFVPPRL